MGELVGVMVALNKNRVVSKSLYISKISLPVHNFDIRMLLIIIKIRLLTLSRLEGVIMCQLAVLGCNIRPSISIV